MGECKHESKQKIGTSSIFIHMPLFLVCRCKVHPVQTSETEGIVWQVHFWEYTYFTFFSIRHAESFPNPFLITIDPPTKQLQKVCPPSSNAQHSHLRQEDAKKSRSETHHYMKSWWKKNNLPNKRSRYITPSQSKVVANQDFPFPTRMTVILKDSPKITCCLLLERERPTWSSQGTNKKLNLAMKNTILLANALEVPKSKEWNWLFLFFLLIFFYPCHCEGFCQVKSSSFYWQNLWFLGGELSWKFTEDMGTPQPKVPFS